MPSTELRQTVLATAKRVVIKLGTQVLTAKQGGLDLDYIWDLAGQIVALRNQGIEVTVVSSGAIGAGRGVLNLPKRPADVAQQQAVAAIGQRQLMTCYHQAFLPHKLHVAQILLTRGDLDDRVRYLNFRNSIGQVHQYGAIPIINENDSVAVDEIRFGDNDMLAALVCNALRADALIILSSVAGLLDENNQRVDLVQNVHDVMNMARAEKSKLGTGGMKTKLQAMRLVTDAGEIAVIAHGREPQILPRLLAGDKLGTIFVPATKKLDSRRRWIGLTRRPVGNLTIDDGAVRALQQRGKSLLASGITAVEGTFARGGVVAVLDPAGNEIARGLSNYADDELRRIMGQKSAQFEKILGHQAYDEVIHRDNMVVLRA
ncbi:MAG: glutamate 5-kinase [Phycisphaeraceae bacterium]|nr:glutamate 5-kinase [Phycisphaeraceae bacterium]